MFRLASSDFAARFVSLIAFASLCLSGCATPGLHLDSSPESLSTSIAVGNQLIITTSSVTEKSITVTGTDQMGLYSDSEFFAYDEIQSARVAPNATGQLLTGIVVIAAIAGILVLAEAAKGVNELNDWGN